MSSFPTSTSSTTIEFPCTQCGRRLQVTREAIGRQAQCPECQSVQTVPHVDPSQPTAGPAATPAIGPSAASSPNNAGGEGIAFDDQPAAERAGQSPAGMPEDPPSPSVGFGNTTRYGNANSQTRELFERIRNEIHKLFVGQDELVLGTLTALFSGGHVLIESVPGLGKTPA